MPDLPLSKTKLKSKKQDSFRSLTQRSKLSTVIWKRCSTNGRKKSQKSETNLPTRRLWKRPRLCVKWDSSGLRYKIEWKKYLETASTLEGASQHWPSTTKCGMSSRSRTSPGDSSNSSKLTSMLSPRRSGSLSERRAILLSKNFSSSKPKSSKRCPKMWL